MVQTLAVLAALAAPSHAAPGVPILKQSPKAARAGAPARFAAAPEDLADVEQQARALLREATSLRLSVSTLRRRPERPDVESFLDGLRAWSRDLRALERRTLTLSAAPRQPGFEKPAERLAASAENLYAEASGLSGEATWLAFDLRGRGLTREASDAERLARSAVVESRQLVSDADAIAARLR
jgi:hypothetical protein